jgi:hypothetical protein
VGRASPAQLRKLGPGAIEILADVAVGAKERAVLVQVGRQQLLLGVAPGRVNTLHVLTEPVTTTPRQPAGLVRRNRSGGAARLQGHPEAEPRAVRFEFDRLRVLRSVVLLLALLLPFGSFASGIPAVTVSTAPGGGQQYSLTLQVLILMTAVTLLPSIVLMMTSFTRIIIVLGLLRQALGAGQSPPNQVLIGLSLFLTLFVMGPVIDKINADAVQPYMAGTIDATTAMERASCRCASSCSSRRARATSRPSRASRACRASTSPKTCRCASWCRRSRPAS